MQLNGMGADETAPGGLLTSTDFDTVVKRIADKLSAYERAGNALVALKVTPYIGRWLEAAIAWARTNKKSLVKSNSNSVLSATVSIGLPTGYAGWINRAYMDVQATGLVPDTIAIPYQYTPVASKGIAAEAAAAFAESGSVVWKGAQQTLTKVLIFAVLAAGAYALMSNVPRAAAGAITDR